MADAEQKKQVEWEVTERFKLTWRKAKKENRKISDAMTVFDRCKRSVPPDQLPGKMKEHKLDGPLKGYYDCHLDDDVIMIFKPMKGGGYKLLTLCDHSDLKGPKAKVLAAQLK